MVRLVCDINRPLLNIISCRGACYYTTENNDCPTGSVLSSSQRNANIKAWASQITAAGLPWLYWQVLPNADPHVSVSVAHAGARPVD